MNSSSSSWVKVAIALAVFIGVLWFVFNVVIPLVKFIIAIVLPVIVFGFVLWMVWKVMQYDPDNNSASA